MGIDTLRLHQVRLAGGKIDGLWHSHGRVLPSWLEAETLQHAVYDSVAIDATELKRILVATGPTSSSGMTFRGLVIRGDLDLSGCMVNFPLRFIECHFVGVVNLNYARLRFLDLSHSVLHLGLEAEGLRLDGDLFCHSVVALATMNLIEASIAGQWILDDAELYHPSRSLVADGIRVESGLFAARMEAHGPVRLVGAQIGSTLALRGARLWCPDAALIADRIRVAGGLFAATMRTRGSVSISGAEIKSLVELTDSVIGAMNSESSLQAIRLSLDGDLVASGTRIANTMDLTGADIKGNLNLDWTFMDGSESSLEAAGLRVGGRVFAYNAWAQGEVNIDSARVSGGIFLQRATLRSPGMSLTGAHMNLDGPFDASRIRTAGEINLTDARINGPLGLSYANLQSEGNCLTADRLQNAGGVFAAGLRSNGEVRFLGAVITGQMTLEGSELRASPVSFSGDRVSVSGNLFLDGLETNGQFRLHSAEVGGQLSLDCTARVSMPSLSAQEFIPQSTTDAPPPQLGDVTGWRFTSVTGVLSSDRRAAARALASQSTAQPWQQLADCYERMGQPSDARWVRYRSAVRSTRGSPFVAQISRTLYRLSTGHGYYPWIAAVWLVAIFAMSFTLADLNSEEFSVPVTPSIRADLESHQLALLNGGQVPGLVPTSWWDEHWDIRAFRPGAYAASIAFPAADAGRANAWLPPSGLLSYTFAALKLGAWGFSLLLVAGLTGLLRRST